MKRVARYSSHSASTGDWRRDPEGVWVLWEDIKDFMESGHDHDWRPVTVENWITVPTKRIVALCSCGETRRFAVEDAE